VSTEAGLADVVASDLDVIFVGINPGLGSVVRGHNFATPSNRFWPALHRSGFTPQLMNADQETDLLPLGLGITSIVRRPTARASELSRQELIDGGQDLTRRIRALRPRWLGMLGVTAYRVAFAAPDAQVGPQPAELGVTRIWLLPNPSGLNAHYPPAALAEEFARFRRAVNRPPQR
jgi:TDG/mug DNA glycosylase family protein